MAPDPGLQAEPLIASDGRDAAVGAGDPASAPSPTPPVLAASERDASAAVARAPLALEPREPPGASARDSVALTTSAGGSLAPPPECKGIRPTGDFPRSLAGLTPEQIAHHYAALRNSHASLSRSRGQLLRRSREFSEARERFLTTLRGYEQRLLAIGAEKAEAMRLAQDMHRELEAFEARQQSLDRLLDDLDTAKREAGFWSVFQINQLLERMRELLRGGRQSDG